MCAISGVFAVGRAVSHDSTLRKMSASMRGRGPDGSGLKAWPDCLLAHERLAIIDLTTGQQPITNEDGRYGVVVNGEIYNFKELRGDLQSKGHLFKTQSDSEVVLHGYEEYGSAIFERLDGMFAVALWDGVKHELILARDRLGKKPLAYYTDSEGFWFASEVRAFKILPHFNSSLSSAAISDFLSFRYITGTHSIYQGVAKVPPGHWMRINRDQEACLNSYATLPSAVATTMDYTGAQEELRRLMRDAVQKRMVSDVPLGLLLSAGLDSTIVAYEMAQLGGNLKTFTLGFRGIDDERQAAAETARTLHSNHYAEEVDLTEESCFSTAISAYDEPLADSSTVATYTVCRAARRHVTVALCGDGGDEAFAGYNHLKLFNQSLTASMGWTGSICHLFSWHLAGLGSSPWKKNRRSNLEAWRLTKNYPDPWQRWLALRGVFNAQEVNELIGHKTNLNHTTNLPFGIQEAQAYDYESYLSNNLLVKMDRASMSVALEVRAPFLDDQIVRFGRSLPINWKINSNGEGKRILRDAYREDLPPHVWTQPKRGFQMPVKHWLRHGFLRTTVDNLINDRSQPLWAVLDYKVTEIFLQRFMRGSGNEQQVWSLLVLNRWLSLQ